MSKVWMVWICTASLLGMRAPALAEPTEEPLTCGSIVNGELGPGDETWGYYAGRTLIDYYDLLVEETSVFRFEADLTELDGALPVVLFDTDGNRISAEVQQGTSGREYKELVPGLYKLGVYYPTYSFGYPLQTNQPYEIRVVCPDLDVYTCGGAASGSMDNEKLTCIRQTVIGPPPILVCEYQLTAWDEFVLTMGEPSVVDIDKPEGTDVSVIPLTGLFAGVLLPEGRYLDPGDYLVTVSKSATAVGIKPVIEDRSYTVSISCSEPGFQPEDALDMLAYPLWVPWSVPEALDPPVFSSIDGGYGPRLGLHMNSVGGEPFEGVNFGFWETAEPIPAPPAGIYRLVVKLDGYPDSNRAMPDVRVRVHGPNGLVQNMSSVSTHGDFPDSGYVTVLWQSDGEAPWMIAIDLLAYRAEHAGGFHITEVRNFPVQLF